jgi:hypothetical protein
MSGWLTRAGGALAALLLLAYAYAPVVTAGLAAGEFHTLVDVERILHPATATPVFERAGGLWEVHGVSGRPLAGLSLLLSRLVQPGVIDAGALVALRLENLLWLLAAGAAIGVFTRRLLQPWTGSDQARAAGRATALLIALAPLHGAAVGSVDARGDLVALFFSGAGGALFLQGRQERRHALVLASALALVLAGAASRLALGMPAVLAAAEFSSARRQRAAPTRLRTAGTTCLVSGVCVALPPFASRLAGFSTPSRWREPSWSEALAIGLERLGALILPINAAVWGPLGFALAGALVLLAVQPALVAARSAPRLWGWMLGGWFLATLLFELLATPARVHPEDLTRAATLLFTSSAASVGLGVATTAISGLRRTLLPLALAAGAALLAHENGRAWNTAARAAAELRGDLLAAREPWRGDGVRLLAVDPPERVAGLDPLRGALPWMLDPLFVAGLSEPVRAQMTSRRGLAALAREVEFEELRAEPLIVVYAAGDGARTSVRLEPVEPFDLRRSFFREGRLDLDVPSAGARALVATVKDPANTSEPPRLGWRTAAGEEAGQLTGAWIQAEDGARAVFDLCSSLEWLLSPRIKSIFSTGGWSRIEEAVLQDALPLPALTGPEIRGGDWVFRPGPGPAPSEGVWTLELLDLTTLAFEERAVAADPGGSFRAPGAERHVANRLAEGGRLAWSLVRRVDGVAVECLPGRR